MDAHPSRPHMLSGGGPAAAPNGEPADFPPFALKTSQEPALLLAGRLRPAGARIYMAGCSETTCGNFFGLVEGLAEAIFQRSTPCRLKEPGKCFPWVTGQGECQGL